MKVLFLDIDGVLNSERTRAAFGGYPQDFSPTEFARFDPVAIKLVQRLCNETGAQVVMSSAWRNFFTAKDFREHLDLPVIDVTPDLSVQAAPYSPLLIAPVRGEEIKAWLDKHPEVTAYAIVDDMVDMLEEQLEFFVRTDDRNGLSYNEFLQLRNILQLLPSLATAA